MPGPAPTDERRSTSPPTGTRPHWRRPRARDLGGPRGRGVERRERDRSQDGLPHAYPQSAPSSRLLRREQTYRYALLVADLLAGLTALEISLTVVGENTPSPLAALLGLPLLVGLSKLHGLYDRDDLLVRKTTVEELPRLFQHAVLATLVAVIFDGQLGIGEIGDGQALAMCLLLVSLSTLLRMLARRLAARLSDTERILVLGSAEAERNLHERSAGRVRAEFVGAIPLERIVSHEDLRRTVRAFDVDRVIIVPSTAAAAAETPELIRAAKAAGVRVSVLPGVMDVVGSQVEFDDVFGVTLLGVRRFGLTRSSRAVKRAFDIAVAALVAIPAAPLIGLGALLVKLDSPGPALFRQERIGFRGRRFQMLKLRTMVDGADGLKADLVDRNEVSDGMFKIAEDPRITRAGRVLRKTHLDELPQLYNVLRGQMSIVGPRPLVRDEDEQITGLDRRRLELMPGMTGPWQILGSHRRIPMAEMVKLDYLYAANWSLWNDLKILLRTATTVLRRSGV